MNELTGVQGESTGPKEQKNNGSNEEHAPTLTRNARRPPMLSFSAAEVQEMEHDHDDRDEEQNVDESARDAKSESAHPKEQKDSGDNEEHAREIARAAVIGLGTYAATARTRCGAAPVAERRRRQ